MSSPLQAQNPSQKISLEVGQVRELTKKAKKSIIFENQNTALLQENTQMKTILRQKSEELEAANSALALLQKRWHYTLIGLVIVGAFLLIKIFR